jgi:hypothetical protein
MAFVTWLPNSDGDWDTASNWSGGVLPTSADTVVISTTTKHTMTHSTGDDFAGSLSVGNDLFSMTGGSLTVVGAVAMANGFSMSGGVSSLGTTATITGTFDQTGGSLSVGGTLTVNGEAQLEGGYYGAYLGASTILQASGPIVLSNYTLGGQAQIKNTTVIYQTGNITLGDNSGVDALIATAVGASYDFANAVNVYKGAATAEITSAGTMAALAGTGASAIAVSVTSTGIVSAAVGSALAFQGPITTLSGTITGAGTISIAGGTATLAAGMVINAGTFAIYNNGTDLTLGGNETISGSFSESWGSTLSLAGHVLTLAGGAQFQQLNGTPLISGKGTLVTKSATGISGYNPGLVIGSTAVWQNYGTVTDYQSFQIGSSASGTAAIVNEASGVFDLTAGGVDLNNGSTPVSTLTNAGTLAMIANGGTGYLGIDVTSTKLITSAATDNLEFDAQTNSIGGTISGSGQVSFANAGTTTIAGNTKIAIGTLALYSRGTNLAIAGSVTDSGIFTQSDGTTLTLNVGTFTITGAAQFRQANGTPDVNGMGTLVTKGTTTLINGGTPLIVGGSIAWLNDGIANQDGYLQIGDSDNSSASVTNVLGASFLINANNVRISDGSSAASFVNAGTFEMTTNAGTSFVDVLASSTGTVLAAQGTNLIFDGATDTFAGTLTGAGQISLAAGVITVAAGTKLSAAKLAVYGNGTTLSLMGIETVASALALSNNSTLMLGGATTISGSLTEQDNSVIALGANTLTVTGAAQFQQGSGSPDIKGTGTLVTQGTTSLVGGGTALVIGSSATWSNTGSVFDSASYVQIGDTTGVPAEMVNAAGGLFELLSNGSTITNGSTPYSSLVNAGTLEMAANGGMAYVNVIASSTGTVVVLQGDNLQFDGPSTSLAGTITGAGQLSFGSGSGTIAGATVITVGTLQEYNNGTSLALSGDVTDSGSFYQGWGSTLALGGHTLTLAGAAEFQQYYGTPLVTGPGTLVTDGLTTLTGSSSPLEIGSTAAWDNNGTVLDYQSFQIGSSSSAAASVVNETGATFDLVASVGINNGSTPVSSFTNAGLLEMTNFGGSSSMNEAFTNTGTVLAQGGRMSFLGPVSGTGTMEISAGGELGFSSTVASTETVDFLDNTGSMSLTLTTPTSFGADISGFVQGDTIDLTGISNATGTFANGVLTFTNNTSHAVVATLHFTNTPNFTFASDGNGGTLIGDPHR